MIFGASALKLTLLLPFDEVAQDLAQEQNLVRIKKLLIYVCTQVWESDRHCLGQVKLLDLLQDLRAIAPTVEQLRSRLDTAVFSLSKAAEYTLVANVIMTHAERLYPVHPGRGGQQEGSDEGIYGAIAQSLTQNVSGDRIKKLLLLACRSTWVTDPTQLAQVNVTDLIRDLHGLAPNLVTLQTLLEGLVNTLNKSSEYTIVSQEISNAFQPLYPKVMTEIGNGAIAEEVPVQILSSDLAPSQALDLANLFDLRLEIMRYTNPYRAKIVLFSLLHQPFTNSAEPESMVRSYALDDLLRAMLQVYKWSDVEVQLLDAAKNLEDSEECVQVARVILGAVKPLYARMLSTSATQSVEDATTALAGKQAIAVNAMEQKTHSYRDEGGESDELAIVTRPIPNLIPAHPER